MREKKKRGHSVFDSIGFVNSVFYSIGFVKDGGKLFFKILSTFSFSIFIEIKFGVKKNYTEEK